MEVYLCSNGLIEICFLTVSLTEIIPLNSGESDDSEILRSKLKETQKQIEKYKSRWHQIILNYKKLSELELYELYG